MDHQLKDFNEMDVDMDDQALKPLEQEQEQQEAETAATGLREVLREYDLSNIIRELGESDVLDALGAHRIMDYVCYLSMERTDMREPGSKRMIFRREILALARRIEAQSELDRLFEEQARDLAEIETAGRQWLPPVSEEELLERMAEQERERNGL